MIFIRKWGKIIFLEGPLSLFYKIIIYSEIWVSNFAVQKITKFFNNSKRFSKFEI